MHCMVASSIPFKLSLCADRMQTCAGDSHASSGINVACPTTQSALAIASPHESPEDSWPSSPTGTRSFCCNHQYSVTAVTTSAGAIAERYAYSAYGQPTILDGSGSVLSSSATNNRYTYTGREWDATLGLYHFRARWMSGIAGRFMGRDPIGYVQNNFEPYSLGGARPMIWIDPTGEIALRLSEFVQDGKPKRDEPKKDYNDCQFLPDTPKECKGGYCLSTKDPKVGNCKITSVVGDKDNSYVCRLVTPERICSHLKKTVEDSGKTNPGKTIEHDFCSNGCSCDYANAKMNDAPFFIILINDVVMQERPGIVRGFTCKFTISGTIEVTGGSVAILPCKKAGK